MLQWSPKARASASQLLDDPWLRIGSLDTNTHMDRQYYREWRKIQKRKNKSGGVSSSSSDSESESESQGDEDYVTESSDKSSKLSIEDESNLSDLVLAPSAHDAQSKHSS